LRSAWTAAAGCAAALWAASPAAGASPAPRHRAFWDVSLGPVRSTNVYRDSSEEADTGYDLRARVGLRSRFSPRTFAQLHYDLDALSFGTANVENRRDHAFAGLVRHRLSDPLTLEGKAGLRLSRFPNVAAFDSTTAYGQAALKGYLTTRTTLEGGLAYEATSYPDYDLDNHSVGVFGTLARDFGRRTFGELSMAFRSEDYSERLLRDPTSTDAPDDPRRRDHDWFAGARVVRDFSLVLQLEAAYQYGRLSSNGDSLDFGPFQSALADVPGDERLVSDFYSHRRHEIRARLRRLIRRGSSVTLAARFQDRAYFGRLARDADEQFLSPEEKRHDRALLVSATVDVPIPVLARRARFGHFGLRLRLAREMNQSNEALYDYGSTVAALSFTSWF